MDKRSSLDGLVRAARDARTISFGGGGTVRKPMAAASAIGLSDVDPMNVITLLGGPEVDLLVGLGKVAHLQFAYMGFGPLGMLPNFRAARQAGTLDVIEASEYLIIASYEAASHGVPFLPTFSGLGTDVLTRDNTPYKVFPCPITGTSLVAVPAAEIDLAVIHVNVADTRGNCLVYGDCFIDSMLARAASSVWVTAERVVDELPSLDSRPAATFISRLWIDAVIEAPGGSGFTDTFPDNPWNLEAALEYRDNCTQFEWLKDFAAATATSSFAGAGATVKQASR